MHRSQTVIDITKYVAALCVVAIHTFTTSPITNIGIFLFIQGIARLAVPFFFCSTGYFMGKRGIQNPDIVFPYIKKILRLYAVWTIVYVPVQLIQMVATNTLNPTSIRYYLHSFIVQGSFLHLWYFPAIMFAVLALHFLFRKLHTVSIGILAIILYGIGLLGDGYFGVLRFFPNLFSNGMQWYMDIFLTTRNGLFFGIPFVFIGIMIAKNEEKIQKHNFHMGLFISIVLVCMEAHLLEHFSIAADYNMTLSLVPATIYLFCTLLTLPKEPQINGKIFREYSILIYECHLIFFGVILGLVSMFSIPMLHIPAVQFLSVCVLSQLFSCLVITLTAKRQLYWLKTCY